MHVTLRQIANQVGCSRSTVSYALKNNPNISQEMRDKVMQAARELGWRPDAELARQLAFVRNTALKDDLPNLALIINKSSEALEVEFSPKAQLLGARNHARNLGYHVDIFNLADSPLSADRLSAILQARGIEGIVFIATVNPEIPEEVFEIGKDYACAVAGIRHPQIPYHLAVNDFLGDCIMAVRQVMERGYNRPGVLLPGGLDRMHSFAYSGGLSAGMMYLEPTQRLPLGIFGDKNYFPDAEWEWIRDYIRRHRPDCLLTTDYVGVPRIRRELEMEGIETAVFILDWFPDQDVDGGVYCRQEHVGEGAVDMVIRQLHQGESGFPAVQRSLNIEGAWVDSKNEAWVRASMEQVRTQARAEAVLEGNRRADTGS